MPRDIYDVIRRPLVTEKGETSKELLNAYYFEVASDANKSEIKHAIESLYAHKGIKVRKVCTMNKKPKARRFRFKRGHTRAWKKAVVYLDPEQKLELY